MTLIAAHQRPPDSVVLALPEFRLEPGEPLAVGLKRLSLREIETSVSAFYDGEEVFASAVHEGRKSIKRLRALLRLVRSEIGEKVYLFENDWLQQTGALLGEVRSAAVNVETLSGVRELYEEVLAAGIFEESIHRLSYHRDRVEERTMEDPEIIPRFVANMERAHDRYSSWPTDPSAREVYGVGIANDFAAVGPGLRHTYQQGRQEMVMAYDSPHPERFHAWRKRAKYLRHQMEILTPLWPEVVLGMALTLERIGALLGEDHDLAELLQLLASRPGLCPNPVERTLLKALAEQRRSDLQTASRILGRRVYAEAPGSLHGRFEAYWESAEQARSLTLSSVLL